MLAIHALQEGASPANISWLVWVVLVIFLIMVLLGWWASGRLPNDDEVVVLHEGSEGQEDHDHGPAHDETHGSSGGHSL
jgi:hypothetical protein